MADGDVNINKAKQMLRIYDSIHDFWKKRGAQSASEDEEGLSDNLLELVRDDLNEKIYTLRKEIGVLSPRELTQANPMGGRSKQRTTPINEQLKQLSSDNKVTNIGSATSTFELNVQNYFESHPTYKKYLLEESKLRISYQEIISTTGQKMPGTSVPPEWNKYINNIETQRILEVYDDANHNSGISFKEILYNDEYKNIVNTFVLCYMNGGWDETLRTPSASPKAYFTFDAAGKYVKKLLKDDVRMSNLITPQNIADSATTSFNQLNDRIRFHFPVNNAPTEPSQFTVTSDVFNRNNDSLFELNFKDRGFNEQNRYGFDIEVNYGLTQNIEFNEHEKEGPSVNYLGSLINEFNDVDAIDNIGKWLKELQIYKKNTVVDLVTPIKNILEKSTPSNRNMLLHYFHDSGIFYDFKRMGDHEQCEAAKQFSKIDSSAITVVVTLDRLCSLYSRLIEQPCIFHNNETLTLFRFPRTVDPVSKRNADYYFKLKEIVETYNSTIWVNSLETQLNDVRTILATPLAMMIQRDPTLKNVLVQYPVKYRDDEISINSRNIVNLILTIKILSIIQNINYYLQVIQRIKTVLGQLKSSANTPNDTLLSEFKKLIQNYSSISSEAFASTLSNTIIGQSKSASSLIDDIYNNVITLKQNEMLQLEKIKQTFNLSFDNNGNVVNLISENEILINHDDLTVPKNGSNSYLGLYFSSYRTTFESLTKLFRLISNQRMIDRFERNNQSLYELFVKTGYFDNMKKITSIEFALPTSGTTSTYIEQLEEIIFIQKSTSNSKIITQFNSMVHRLFLLKNNLIREIQAIGTEERVPQTIDTEDDDITLTDKIQQPVAQGALQSNADTIASVQPLPVKKATKRRRKTSIEQPIESEPVKQPRRSSRLIQPRRSPRLIQTGGQTDKTYQYLDFGEVLFEIMSRCSEFYYSILSTTAENNLDTFLNFDNILTQDKYKESISELYQDCSIHIQNQFFDINNYNIENGDAYTFQPDAYFDYITYLFLYDDAVKSIPSPTTTSGAASSGMVASGSAIEIPTTTENTLINYGETIYGDEVGKRIQTSSSRASFAASGAGTDELPINPDFINIVNLLEKTDLKNVPLLVKFMLTFTFALLYDLSYESLKTKSKFLQILYSKGFGQPKINSLVSDYTTKTKIENLMNRIYIFLQTVLNVYNQPGEPVSPELKSLLRGGTSINKNKKIKKKSNNKVTKKRIQHYNRKRTRRNKKG